MGSKLDTSARAFCVGVALAVLSACSGGESHRKATYQNGTDAGQTAKDSGTPGVRGDSGTQGQFQYSGSTVPAGGTVMQNVKYTLFSVTGEIPGTTGLEKNTTYKMVGGIVGKVNKAP